MANETFSIPKNSPAVTSYEDLQDIFRFQIIWEQICFILGIFGNSFVLYATTAHNAIRLDRMSIWIIQLLAVADLGNCFFIVLPTLITQYGKLDHIIVFGETFYIAMGCYNYVFVFANILLVNLLSLNKLMRCMFPLRSLTTSKRQKIFVAVITVVYSLLPTVWALIDLAYGFRQLDPSWMDVRYLGARDVGKLYLDFYKMTYSPLIPYLLVVVLCGLPCVSLMLINSALLIFAMKRSNSSVNKSNLLVVVLVTLGFLMSYMPEILSQTLLHLNFDRKSEEMGWAALFFSSWTNPLIYFFVNPTFRTFTISKVLCREIPLTPGRSGRVQPFQSTVSSNPGRSVRVQPFQSSMNSTPGRSVRVQPLQSSVRSNPGRSV